MLGFIIQCVTIYLCKKFLLLCLQCISRVCLFVYFLEKVENEFIAKCFMTVPPPNSEQKA